MGALVIRGKETARIHLSEIGFLLIESTAVAITTSLLCELVERKIKVVFCDEKHNPCSELVSLYGCHNVSAQLRKQLAWCDKTKAEIWTTIVQDKIRLQAKHLEMRSRTESRMLHQYWSEVQEGDLTNREGHAAKVYFNALFGKSFTRSDDSNTINAALNYGYSLLLSVFNREVVTSGRLTQLGIWHNNTFNYFNLSSDFMEPFRPFVDHFVFELNVESKDFSVEVKHEMLKVMEILINVNGSRQRLPNAIKLHVQKTLAALDDNDPSVMAVVDYAV